MEFNAILINIIQIIVSIRHAIISVKNNVVGFALGPLMSVWRRIADT